MSKKAILIVVVIGVFGLLTCLAFNIISKTKEKNQIAKQLEIIPEFKFLTLEQQSFTKSNLKITYRLFLFTLTASVIFANTKHKV